MLLYALTIFLSAFLLFQVQPLIGKYILPWFGGSSAVWTTCMLFFQLLLLGGYSYAHLLGSRLKPRGQGVVHLALLGAALLVLPIIPSDVWKPEPGVDPTWRILLLLTVTVGLPYGLLASTGPLLQRWFSRTYPGRSPYRLYALSNVGSLLALLTYPVLFEVYLELETQAWAWSIAWIVFAVLCAACAVVLMARDPEEVPDVVPSNPGNPAVAAAEGAGHEAAGKEGEASFREETETGAGPAYAPGGSAARAPGVTDVVLWLALAACGSVILLATTNLMCQDVAVVPFLWVLPLSLYLLTFVICFDNERWYVRPLFVMAMVVAIAWASVVLHRGVSADLLQQIAAFSFVVFACCMVCHGELVLMKPHPRHLTLFYLMVSAGGALGGAFVAIVAPHLFDGYWEFHVGLIACCVLVLAVVGRQWVLGRRRVAAVKRPADARLDLTLGLMVGVVSLLGVGALSWLLYDQFKDTFQDVKFMGRNFYGVLRVTEEGVHDPELHKYELLHGRIMHGFQFQDEERREWKTSYYGPDSGIGLALEHHPRRKAGKPLRIGVIGLGTGSISVYATSDDRLRFYDINPMVVEVANEYFSYLKDARRRGADVDIFLGDARIVMERQLEAEKPQQFDLLAVDAFSSDAIPIHLLTEECAELYWKHLKPDGVLAVHISNRYLDLSPVVRALAEVSGKKAYWIDAGSDDELGIDSTDWVLVTDNEPLVERLTSHRNYSPWPEDEPPLLWTDRYSNLFGVIKD